METTGDKVHVSYSELATFRDCPLKWWLKYGPPRLQEPERSIRLDRGTAWHRALEVHYMGIREGKPKPWVLEAVRQAIADEVEKYAGTDTELETLRWMYEGYIKTYGSDPEHTILRTEYEWEFPFPVPGAPEMTILGRIDLETESELAHAKGRTVRKVWDHKSASNRDVSKDGYVNEMQLEDQFVLYAWAKREAGERVHSVVYNAARTDKLKRAMTFSERFNRVSIPYSDAALDMVLADYRATAEALVRMYNGDSPVYSAPNPKQCSWKCAFQRAHIESRATGKDIVEVALGFGFTERKPGALPVELEAEAPSW